MLKWRTCEEDDSLIRLPRLFIKLAIIFYMAAFALILVGWVYWLSTLVRYNQTILLMSH